MFDYYNFIIKLNNILFEKDYKMKILLNSINYANKNIIHIIFIYLCNDNCKTKPHYHSVNNTLLDSENNALLNFEKILAYYNFVENYLSNIKFLNKKASIIKLGNLHTFQLIYELDINLESYITTINNIIYQKIEKNKEEKNKDEKNKEEKNKEGKNKEGKNKEGKNKEEKNNKDNTLHELFTIDKVNKNNIILLGCIYL